MIELTKLEVKTVSGGMYYTLLGTALGAFSTVGWFVSMAGKEVFSKNHEGIILKLTVIVGAMGAIVGSVVGNGIDKASGQ